MREPAPTATGSRALDLLAFGSLLALLLLGAGRLPVYDHADPAGVPPHATPELAPEAGEGAPRRR